LGQIADFFYVDSDNLFKKQPGLYGKISTHALLDVLIVNQSTGISGLY